jgi:hypothetical protein
MFLYLFCFFFCKIRGQEEITGSVRGEDWQWWEGGGGGERDRRIKTVQILYTHVCKCKNDTC